MPAPDRVQTLVADDERLARELLATLVRRDTDLELVGTAANGAEVVAAVAEKKPDLLLLDVEMPELDGLSVAEQLKSMQPAPYIIFVTAHDHFAIQAYEQNVRDYLVKPVAKERFRIAISRAKAALRDREVCAITGRLLALHDATGAAAEAPRRVDPITVRSGERLVSLLPEDIIWVEAANQYARVHAADGQCYLVSQTLRRFSQSLPEAQFVRIHRSALVNLVHVAAVENTADGYQAMMSTGEAIGVARNRKPVVSQLLTHARINAKR